MLKNKVVISTTVGKNYCPGIELHRSGLQGLKQRQREITERRVAYTVGNIKRYTTLRVLW